MAVTSRGYPLADLSEAADIEEAVNPAIQAINTDVGAVAAVAAAAQPAATAATDAEVTAHTALTTSAHGGIVATTDPRLSDARAPQAHTHDDRYYTEGEVNGLLNGKSNAGHVHDDRYYTETEVNALLLALQGQLGRVAIDGDGNPSVGQGAGWTVAQEGDSTRFRVTFNAPFAVAPLVMVTPIGSNIYAQLADGIALTTHFIVTFRQGGQRQQCYP